jgi:hypothetical protein
MRSLKLILLGLFTALVALLALIATATNAETNSKWLIVDKEEVITDANNLHAATGVSLENNDGSFLTKMLGVNVQILCTAMQVSAGGALLGQGTISEGKLKFTGCETLINKVKNAVCVPHSKGAAAGTIETNWLLGLLVLHILEPGGEHDELLKVFPSVGTLLATLEMNPECVLGEVVTVNGTVFLKNCCSFRMHQVKHLLEQGPLTELWVLKKTAEHLESKLDGSGLIFLTGTHQGLLWFGEAG